MNNKIIMDTGPLVAIINKRDRFHNWVRTEIANLAYPFCTCEAVITEACFLLQNLYGGEDAVMGLVSKGYLQFSFRFNEEAVIVRELMKRYQSVPMSFADACLVRMSELIKGSRVLTLDSDFLIYRKNRQEIINLIIPDEL